MTNRTRDKRPYGSGSLRIQGRKSWRLTFWVPGPDGRKRQSTETVQGTKKQAEEVLRDRLQSVANGGYVARRAETVREFLDRWLATYAATNTTLRTQTGYRAMIERYVQREIGDLPIQKFDGPAIQALYARLSGRGLSARTVLHLHRVLHVALKHAVRWGVLARNPADAVTPPRPQSKSVEVWNGETVANFMSACRDSQYGPLFHIAVLTGLRRSELAGLRWEDVDFDRRRLRVVRTLQRLPGYGMVTGVPKTHRSRRSLSLSPDTIAVLRGARRVQLEARLQAGAGWQESGCVFTRADGRPVHPDQVSHAFTKLARASGLPRLTLHGLRHVHATLLLTAGVHPKVVSERLGHSTVGITLDTYSHVLPSLEESAAASIDEQLVLKPHANTSG